MNALYEQCLKDAERIVASYRAEAHGDPKNWAATTTAIIAGIIGIASAGVGAYASYSQGQSQKKMADYNAKIARNNAVVARNQSDAEVDRIRDRTRRMRGTQATSFLKSGVDLSGSAADVMNDSALQGEMDVLSVVYNGRLKANSAESQASLFKIEGDTALTNSKLSMAGSGMSALGGAAGSFGNYRVAANPTFKA